MSEEKSTKHQWTPILAAIISSLAVVAAAKIGANARSEIAEAKAQVEKLEAQKKEIGEGLLAAQKDLAECRQLRSPDPQHRGDGSSSPQAHQGEGSSEPVPEAPPEEGEATKPARWARIELAIPAGFQHGTVSVDGSPARVLKRLPNYIDIEVPDAGRSVTLRLEGRGKVCEQSVFPGEATGAVNICSGVN
jgi:hypothetical protein